MVSLSIIVLKRNVHGIFSETDGLTASSLLITPGNGMFSFSDSSSSSSPSSSMVYHQLLQTSPTDQPVQGCLVPGNYSTACLPCPVGTKFFAIRGIFYISHLSLSVFCFLLRWPFSHQLCFHLRHTMLILLLNVSFASHWSTCRFSPQPPPLQVRTAWATAFSVCAPTHPPTQPLSTPPHHGPTRSARLCA